MNAQVHQLAEAREYSEARYEREREEIRQTYGDSSVEAAAMRDQALAGLFYRCGWTQEQLAKKEGCERRTVAQRVTFGRFLAFGATGAIPRNMTERRFRSYWHRTTGTNERQRFAAVAKLMQEDIRLNVGTAKKTEVAKPIGKLGVEGTAWYRRTIEGVPVGTGDVQYTLFNEPGLHSFLLWLNELFSIKTPELKKVQVVAAMYATFIKNAEEAKKFWDEVARGGREYEDNAPSTVLDNWLKAAKEGELKEDLKPAQFYQGCIYAWNAYREEKSLKDIKADTRKSWLNPIE